MCDASRSPPDTGLRSSKLGGVYQGQTAHSLRRSALQYAGQHRATTEQLLDMALISTEAVLKRMYLHAGRHACGCQPVRSQAQNVPWGYG